MEYIVPPSNFNFTDPNEKEKQTLFRKVVAFCFLSLLIYYASLPFITGFSLQNKVSEFFGGNPPTKFSFRVAGIEMIRPNQNSQDLINSVNHITVNGKATSVFGWTDAVLCVNTRNLLYDNVFNTYYGDGKIAVVMEIDNENISDWSKLKDHATGVFRFVDDKDKDYIAFVEFDNVEIDEDLGIATFVLNLNTPALDVFLVRAVLNDLYRIPVKNYFDSEYFERDELMSNNMITKHVLDNFVFDKDWSEVEENDFSFNAMKKRENRLKNFFLVMAGISFFRETVIEKSGKDEHGVQSCYFNSSVDGDFVSFCAPVINSLLYNSKYLQITIFGSDEMKEQHSRLFDLGAFRTYKEKFLKLNRFISFPKVSE